LSASSSVIASAQQPLPRLRSTRAAVDSEQFFDAVGQALQLHLKSQEVPDGAIPFYLHAVPKERVSQVDQPFDGITYKVVSSVPYPRSNDGTVSRKPFTFEAPDPHQAGYVIKTDSWMELLTVEFSVWSRSNPTRSKLVNWFHLFMMRYANAYKFFEARGADMFQFVGRGEDDFESHEEQEIYFGTLTYQVRIQLLNNYSQRQIDQLTVDVQFGYDQQTILQTAI
jgi:hypothetical protein